MIHESIALKRSGVALALFCGVIFSGSVAHADNLESLDGLQKALDNNKVSVQKLLTQWTGVAVKADLFPSAQTLPLTAAIDRVMSALQNESVSRQRLYVVDVDCIQKGVNPTRAIHFSRPFNDLMREVAYADRMVGILSEQAKNVAVSAKRFLSMGQEWKSTAGEDPLRVANIDSWLDLVHQEEQLLAVILDLYQQRGQAGWYDRANGLAKYDLPILKIRKKQAYRALTLPVNVGLLDRQAEAQVSVLQAGKATAMAMAAAHAMMTRESPLIPIRPQEEELIPEPMWNLDSLSKPPEFCYLDAEGAVRQILYRGLPYQGKATEVFAYYASPGTLAGDPQLDHSIPALVLVHGGGDRASREWVTFWAKKGYAAISMDLAGCGPNGAGEYDKLFKPERLVFGGPGQDGRRKILDIDLPITDQWPYHAVANTLLAHSLVRVLPGVDPARTAISGISWGGYVTCIAAGIDGRFKAAMPFYGCGFLSENSVWKENGLFDLLTPDQEGRWTTRWDPSMYASRIKMPVFAVTGAKDFAYPLESFSKTYALPMGETQFRITPEMGHGGSFLVRTPEAVVFLDRILQSGEGLPRIGKPKVTTREVVVEVDRPLVSASFHYTVEEGPSKTRVWVTTAVTIREGTTLTAVRPPLNVRVGYFVGVDSNDHSVSSSAIIFDTALSVDLSPLQKKSMGQGLSDHPKKTPSI